LIFLSPAGIVRRSPTGDGMEIDNDYDAFAAAYSEDNENNAFNAFYERPASLGLMGDVAGKRVLDAGCGSGLHAAALIERGARVTGIDKSSALLEIARRRLGLESDLAQADLNEPLAFGSDTFDAILASLVMHYLEDWSLPLREFRRILAPDGRLVISTHHPFMDHALAGGTDYFATYEFVDEWEKGGQAMSMRFWHRPLHAMIDALQGAGFAVLKISEPQPLPEAKDLFPEAYEVLSTAPRFLFLLAQRV
jgi:SAM-dependent methyltransferase